MDVSQERGGGAQELLGFPRVNWGPAAGYAAIAIGLVNSIMFPVIFTIYLERSTASPVATSGGLCFAIIGGAVIPPLTGLVSQNFDYSTALILPAACYLLLTGFALAANRTLPRPSQKRAEALIH
jgi:FHS family L-fucose permease-like MFS transporter